MLIAINSGILEYTMLNKLMIKVVSLLAALALSACGLFTASDDEMQSQNKQKVMSELTRDQVGESELSLKQMQANIEEWNKIKPDIERLISIEGELRELITQLNTMVETQSSPAVNNTILSEKVSFSENKKSAFISKPLVPMEVSVVPPQVSSSIEVSNPNNSKSVISNKFAVQLYSLSDKNALIATWNELLNKNPRELTNLIPVYQEVVVGGKTFYRVKAGAFDSQSEASQLCAKLKATNTSCFTSTYSGTPFL